MAMTMLGFMINRVTPLQLRLVFNENDLLMFPCQMSTDQRHFQQQQKTPIIKPINMPKQERSSQNSKMHLAASIVDSPTKTTQINHINVET